MPSLLDIVREQYVWEAQRRDKLNAAGSIPIGFATVSGGLIASLAAKIAYPFDMYDKITLGLLFLSVISGFLFTYQAICFFLGPVYKYIADSQSIVMFWKESSDYYKKNPRQGLLDQKFEDFLLETYARCGTINCANNDQKSLRLYKMNRWVLAMLLPCLLAALVVGCGQFSQILHVIDRGSNEMADSDSKNSPQPPPAPPPERSVKDGASIQPPKQK